ncbi:hypothetical protein BH09PSE2_BH09PSE2_25040 [soil metagenome]
MRTLQIGLAALAAASALASTALAAPKVGQPAPDFQVTTLDGKTVRLADFKGRVVVLNFWATWCAPCRQELPLLNAFYKLRTDVGLSVLAVSTEDSTPLYELKPLVAALNIPMVRSMRGPYRTLEGVPTNYIIDRNGVLRYAKAEAMNLASLNAVLIPLLNEQGPEMSPDPTLHIPPPKPGSAAVLQQAPTP